MSAITNIVDNTFNLLINLLFPGICPQCNKHSDVYNTSPICKSCWSTLKPYSGNTCSICAIPVDSTYIKICKECFNQRPVFSKVIAFGIYKDTLRHAILLYKFYPFIKRLANPISNLMNNLRIPRADLIAPVPLTKMRLNERGFNQSLLIARHLSKISGIPLDYDLLVKIKETGHQTGLPRHKRIKSLQGAFSVTRKINNKKIIIVDDVITTGTTINECSKALIDKGAKEIYSVVIARSI